MNKIKLKNIKLTGGFWKNRNELLVNEVVPYQRRTLNNETPGVPLSHAVENFRIAAGESEGEPQGTIFQDSDVAKWIEAASFSLLTKPDPELESYIDELVRLIGKSQQEDGYVNTFFTAKGISSRWTDLVMGHEMYCAGHLMEAAVSYYEATGKKEFVNIMCRYADLISREFGPKEEQRHTYGGHPIIEMALYRLAEVTEEDKYRDLADYFVNIRGSVKKYFKKMNPAIDDMHPKSRWFESDYYIAEKAIRDMTEVNGHSVRATYFYAGAADSYNRNKDPELWKALTALWDNMTKKRIYITAGIGSQGHGERFTIDYDLPSENGYTETCASIGLVYWAWRMLQADHDSKYGDMIERAVYNGALSGISLDGKAYFYVNPLEVNPPRASYRQDHDHVETHRQGWFDCACCPTNIARLIGSIGEYLYSKDTDSFWIHQFASSETSAVIKGTKVQVTQKTDFPWDGQVGIDVNPEKDLEMALKIRRPSWCREFSLRLNGELLDSINEEKGYLILQRTWRNGDRIELDWKMSVEFRQADSRVDHLNGKLAVMRGPLVYCFEEADNGTLLNELSIDTAAVPELISGMLEPSPSINIKLQGFRETIQGTELYPLLEKQNSKEKVSLTAIPYFQWGNRKLDQEMRVWMRKA